MPRSHLRKSERGPSRDGSAFWRVADSAQAIIGGTEIDSRSVAARDRRFVVSGLGDAAYFSKLLLSLLLKDDTLVGMELSLVPRPEKKFRKLATTLLSLM